MTASFGLPNHPSLAPHKPSNYGTFLAILSGVLYGTLGYLGISQIQVGFNVYDMLFWRFMGAALLIMPFVIRSTTWHKFNLPIIGLLFFLGGGTYAACALFYFLAAENLGTGIAMMFFFAFPVFVALLSWILDRHRLGRLTYVSMMILFSGLWLLADKPGSGFDWVDALFALASGVTYAVYVYLGKKIKVNPLNARFNHHLN